MMARGFVGAAFPHRTSRPGIRTCIGTCSWRTSPGGSTDAGRRWTAGRSTTPPVPAVWCSRRRCAASSPLRSVSSGVRCTRTRPRSPASHRAVLREFSQRQNRSPSGWRTPARRALRLRRSRNVRPRPQADAGGLRGGRGRMAARAEAAGWGPAELEQLLASAVPAAVRGGFVVEDESWRHGVRSVMTRLVGFDEWLDWLLITGSRRSRDVHPLRSHPGRRAALPADVVEVVGGHREASAGVPGRRATR